jgi:dolichyl-phosphooligosaccharide-protein glycotransferase
MTPRARAEDVQWRTTLWTIVALTVFFGVAVFLRAYFNYGPSYSDGQFRWSGTDPFYHLRVMEHILVTGEFLLFDRLINYPVGAINPRPPLFSWTTAAVGGLLTPIFGGDALRSLHMVAMFSPAVWAGLTVIPVYLLAKTAFNRAAGLWAAFLVAIMPAHMMRAALGNVDHDALIMFLITFGAWAFVKSLKLLRVEEYVADYRAFDGVKAGYKRFFQLNQASIAYALLAGAFWAAVALTWKGFIYIFGILAIWYGFQLLSNHLRHRDNTAHFIVGILPLVLALVMLWPYYSEVNRINSWVMPSVIVLVGMLVAALVFVPTRHWPPVLVLPTTLLVAALGLVVLMVFFPERWATLSTGMGYFEQTRLYSTIAEAQRTDMGFLAFSVGIVPFFFALIGIFMALASFIRRHNDDHLFLLVWAGVGIFMAFAASRFVFNSAIPFAVMSGWVIARFVTWVRYGDVKRSWHTFRSAGAGFFRTVRNAVGFRHIVGSIFIVMILLVPSVWLGVDAGVPREFQQQQMDEDETRAEFWQQRFGAFGQSFLSRDWVDAMAYLRDQDPDIPADERPAFIAWWDYGFYAANRGNLPTVADPFQFGYQISGRFLASVSEAEAITWLAIRALEGDTPGGWSPEVEDMLNGYQPGLADELRPLIHRGRDYDEAYLVLARALSEAESGAAGNGDAQAQQIDPTDIPEHGPDDEPMGIDEGPDTAEVPTPDLDQIVQFYRDVRDATGFSIRYFALDGRMFPCDDPRSPGVDSGSIFYAPVFLAEKNPEDFVRTVYMDAAGQRYYQRIYETTPEGESRELDRPFVEHPSGQRFLLAGGQLFPMAPGGFIDYTSELARNPIQLTRDMLEYQPVFYDTILYRAWLGSPPADPQQRVPPPDEVSPGDGLRHFRMVFSTMRVPDTDDVNRCGGFVDGVRTGYSSGVTVLKYFDGAPIEGTVTDSDGNPLAGTTVQVADNFGIGHDRTETDEDGRFSLVAPFSTEDDPSALSGTERSFTMRGTGANQLQVVVGDTVIQSIEFSITDDQAMGLEAPPEPFAIEIELGSLSGRIFHDEQGDGAFNETAGDAWLQGAEVRLGDRNTTTDSEGRFSFANVLPGDREVTVFHPDYEPGFTSVDVPPGEAATLEVGLRPAPIEVSGALTHEGQPVAGANVMFTLETDEQQVEFSDPAEPDGMYRVVLPPGTWEASVEYETFDPETGEMVRYFTPQPQTLSFAHGDGPQTLDLELQRETVEQPEE